MPHLKRFLQMVNRDTFQTEYFSRIAIAMNTPAAAAAAPPAAPPAASPAAATTTRPLPDPAAFDEPFVPREVVADPGRYSATTGYAPPDACWAPVRH